MIGFYIHTVFIAYISYKFSIFVMWLGIEHILSDFVGMEPCSAEDLSP